jgi:hypothetical protein
MRAKKPENMTRAELIDALTRTETELEAVRNAGNRLHNFMLGECNKSLHLPVTDNVDFDPFPRRASGHR